MEWHPCSCGKSHPFRVTVNRPCPNQSRGSRESRPAPLDGGVAGSIPASSSREGRQLLSANDATGLAAGVASGPRDVRPKGRPLDKDRPNALAVLKPWVAAGMSRTTWFRRQAEQRAKAKA